MEVRDLIEELKRMDPYAKVKIAFSYYTDYNTRNGDHQGEQDTDRVIQHGSEVIIEGV